MHCGNRSKGDRNYESSSRGKWGVASSSCGSGTAAAAAFPPSCTHQSGAQLGWGRVREQSWTWRDRGNEPASERGKGKMGLWGNLDQVLLRRRGGGGGGGSSSSNSSFWRRGGAGTSGARPRGGSHRLRSDADAALPGGRRWEICWRIDGEWPAG
jgi:hypothetical protein